jgi:hypothetical protein
LAPDWEQKPTRIEEAPSEEGLATQEFDPFDPNRPADFYIS